MFKELIKKENFDDNKTINKIVAIYKKYIFTNSKEELTAKNKINSLFAMLTNEERKETLKKLGATYIVDFIEAFDCFIFPKIF